VVSLVVVFVPVVRDQLIVCDVDCESAGADEEARERASEAVRAGEGTGISPGLSVAELVGDMGQGGGETIAGGRTLLPKGHSRVVRLLQRTFAGRSR